MTTHHTTDIFDPARARALQATLGQAPAIEAGDPLPPFAHHIYFWDPQPDANLGGDGHPAVGGFIPDLGLPRRMWAAGRITIHAPLCAGIKASRDSVIANVTRKSGRSGPLAFVQIRHDIKQRQRLAVTEVQELVYRPADAPASSPTPARTDETASTSRSFTPTQLFRYSALTFNGHRIHYDADYARDVEGYAGLVVHGPLLSHLMMHMAWEHAPFTHFDYRNHAPVIAGEKVAFCQSDNSYWVRGADGRLCASGAAS